jgi:methyltransferase-like protein
MEAKVMTLDDEALGPEAIEKRIERTYDDYPYVSHPFSQTHPERLATLATLFGMNPKPVDDCRVLELGCATGGNLIPMSVQYPGSEFYGIDLSSKQVEEGQRIVSTLGLGNITLEHLSITDLDEKAGSFDYIICHGVFSWVPEEVRDKILAICGAQLKDNGIAYISYNTYPGWHTGDSIRNMMRYHTRGFSKPQDKVNQARALLKFLQESVNTESSPYGMNLKNELNYINKIGNYYIAHEHLEECNVPMYFHEFMEQAQQHGLQYLAETQFSTMLAGNFRAEVATTLKQIGNNIVQMEQYMDFLRNRRFRQTLLCRADQQLNRTLGADTLATLYFGAQVKLLEEGEVNLTEKVNQTFKNSAGKTVGLLNPVTRAAMQALDAAWPQLLAFDDLLQQSIERLPADSVPDRDTLRRQLLTDLLRCYSRDIVELHAHNTPVCTAVSERPLASPLARCQAEIQPYVTNQRHEPIKLDMFSRHVIRLLDGDNDRDAIVEKMEQRVRDGELTVRHGGKNIDDTETACSYIGQFVDKTLRALAREALLVE